jgi:hypothetical protein
MRERPMQFRGEKKTGIRVGSNARPKLSYLRLDVSVEGGVDFDYIKAAGENFQRMLLAA